ncbi:MAG: 50S ribosomal protein L33 [Candidatus Wildermuthbacteria bacterium]|nr:50S ribosomal protein L33 [Candidatus Wildermuthbacteria bacterium]
MPAKTKKNIFFKLRCETCGMLNYYTSKSKGTAEKKLKLSKFCPKCRKHTAHKESKN